jgi:hypothetical protein
MTTSTWFPSKAYSTPAHTPSTTTLGEKITTMANLHPYVIDYMALIATLRELLDMDIHRLQPGFNSCSRSMFGSVK